MNYQLIIRRNLRKASMTGQWRRFGPVGCRPDGLESVKKTDQVAARGVNPGSAGAPPAFIHRTIQRSYADLV
jgi:hypothetical protein